jgi:hypothetical protein
VDASALEWANKLRSDLLTEIDEIESGTSKTGRTGLRRTDASSESLALLHDRLAQVERLIQAHEAYADLSDGLDTSDADGARADTTSRRQSASRN